jgi:hypothetical protein
MAVQVIELFRPDLAGRSIILGAIVAIVAIVKLHRVCRAAGRTLS